MTKDWKRGSVLANALTICRMVLSLALLIPPALSPAFFALYALAGTTDMVDGLVARATGTESEAGARLDSIADFLLVVVCLVRILPVISVPPWLWIWIALIALVKLVNVLSGYIVARRLVTPHTVANRVAGFVVFLFPFALPFTGIAIPAIPACIVATFAAVQEGRRHHQGREPRSL